MWYHVTCYNYALYMVSVHTSKADNLTHMPHVFRDASLINSETIIKSCFVFLFKLFHIHAICEQPNSALYCTHQLKLN